MAEVSIEDIKQLREQTGVGMTDAKKALVDASGDFDKALAAMRKKGLTKAAKRASVEARAGIIGGYTHDGRIGVLAEVNCETEFVAKTDEFKEVVKNICLQIAASAPENVEELLEQEYIKDTNQTVKDYLNEHIAKLGENIVVRRISRMELGKDS